MIYFQIFMNFGYRSLKNSNEYCTKIIKKEAHLANAAIKYAISR